MEVTFNNVTITISEVQSAEQAYDLLCSLLVAAVEFETDTYTVSGMAEERQTSELFPTGDGTKRYQKSLETKG